MELNYACKSKDCKFQCNSISLAEVHMQAKKHMVKKNKKRTDIVDLPEITYIIAEDEEKK